MDAPARRCSRLFPAKRAREKNGYRYINRRRRERSARGRDFGKCVYAQYVVIYTQLLNSSRACKHIENIYRANMQIYGYNRTRNHVAIIELLRPGFVCLFREFSARAPNVNPSACARHSKIIAARISAHMREKINGASTAISNPITADNPRAAIYRCGYMLFHSRTVQS